jgi:hypothetical protein
MYVQMLKAEWRSMGAIIVVLTVVAFGAPLATVIYGANLARQSTYTVASWLSAAAGIGATIPLIALVAGVLTGMAVWSADHLGGHVYALSLPLPRWRYVLLRFGTGLTFLAGPVAALGIGAAIASSVVELPEGLHAYPAQLTLRFGAATVVCYALFFALSTATRRVALALLGLVGGFILADVLLGTFGQDTIAIETGFRLLTTWPGPLAILMGRWALFDV